MIKRENYFKESCRPQFHYTAQSHIINDPNGLFYYEGEYHLMHQYNINNHIHWGHAVSRDLVHWQHLPAALSPDSIGQIWSGSAVVDWENTSGLQCGKEKVIVALFTYNEHVDSQQSQGLAYSNDRGRTWQKYEHNPVLTSMGKPDFRDPKVFWHEESNLWIMVLACGNHVEFYSSSDLKKWEFSGEFGTEEGSHEGVWECPDLFRIPVMNLQEESRWILLVSVNRGAPAGGTGMQYFVGMFDGKSFKNDYPADKVLWLDFGKDFYAGVTWNDIPAQKDRRLMIGWADNWLYRDELPTRPFKGQFSSVRELGLLMDREGGRLMQRPVKEMQHLRKDKYEIAPFEMLPGCKFELPVKDGKFELICEWQLYNADSKVELIIGDHNRHYVRIFYDRRLERIGFDRTRCGMEQIEQFEGIFYAPLQLKNNNLKLHLLVDRSQIELFAQEGKITMTNLFFLNDSCIQADIIAVGSPVRLLKSCCYHLESIWPEKRSEFDLLDGVMTGSWTETVHGFEGSGRKEGLIITSQKFRHFLMKVNIKITPYQDGKIAGMAFGLDESGRGYRVLLDAERKAVSLFDEEKEIEKGVYWFNSGRTYQVCVEVKDRQLKVLIDGMEVMQELLEGYHVGLLGLCVSNTNAVFDQLQIAGI